MAKFCWQEWVVCLLPACLARSLMFGMLENMPRPRSWDPWLFGRAIGRRPNLVKDCDGN